MVQLLFASAEFSSLMKVWQLSSTALGELFCLSVEGEEDIDDINVQQNRRPSFTNVP